MVLFHIGSQTFKYENSAKLCWLLWSRICIVERIRISYFLALSRVERFYATAEQKLIHSFCNALRIRRKINQLHQSSCYTLSIYYITQNNHWICRYRFNGKVFLTFSVSPLIHVGSISARFKSHFGRSEKELPEVTSLEVTWPEAALTWSDVTGTLVATSADSVPSSNLVRITIAPIGSTFGNLQWRRYLNNFTFEYSSDNNIFSFVAMSADSVPSSKTNIF
jgi:hypothetical protein